MVAVLPQVERGIQDALLDEEFPPELSHILKNYHMVGCVLCARRLFNDLLLLLLFLCLSR